MILESTETENPVDYDWDLNGPDGANFILYPERNKHNLDDIKAAKRWLRDNHDVVRVTYEWIEPTN